MSRGALACCVIAFLVAGFFTARNVSSWPERIRYPGEESYEGCALAETLRLAQGVSIYAPPSAQGFAGATYGPLYYLLGARLINVDKPSYTPMRLLSAAAILGCALGAGLLTYWISRSYLAACLSPLVFLSYGVVTFHGVSMLSDNVALFLFFAGFLLAYRFRESALLLLAAPVMTLGFYFKPQFIAGPLAVFAFLLLSRRFIRATQFAGLLGFCGLGMLALLQWVVFRGQEFWRHFLTYQATLFSARQFEIGMLVWALMLAAPLLLALEYLRQHPDRMMMCYFVAAVLLGIATIGKESAFIQYFYESFLVVSILVPALLVDRARQGRAPVEVVLLLTFGLIAGQWYTPPAPSAEAYAQNASLQSYFRENFRPHTRALGFRGGDLVQAGFDTPFSDLFQSELLAHGGVVSDRDLVDRIRERWFSVIVLDFDLRADKDRQWMDYYLHEAARQAIAQNYEVRTSLPTPSPEKLWNGDRFYIYVPIADENASSPR